MICFLVLDILYKIYILHISLFLTEKLNLQFYYAAKKTLLFTAFYMKIEMQVQY